MKNFGALKYAAIFSAPIMGLVALTQYGWLTYAVPLYTFALIPLLELLLPISLQNMSATEEAIAKEDIWYDWVLYLMVPVQYALLVLFFTTTTDPLLTTFEVVGRVLSMGIACGAIGINMAHELGHRKNKFDIFTTRLLLLPCLYMHFTMEHNYGHHKNVATELDPATAKKGQSLYYFWFTSVF